MGIGKLAVLLVVLVLAVGGIAAAFGSSSELPAGPAIELDDGVRKDDSGGGDVLAPEDDDDNNTGDGDNTAGNDGTSGGDNTGGGGGAGGGDSNTGGGGSGGGTT